MSLYLKDTEIANIDRSIRLLAQLASNINVARQVSQTVSDDLIVYEATFLFKRIMRATFGGIHYTLGDTNNVAMLWTTLDEDGKMSERFTRLIRLPLFKNSFRPRFTSDAIPNYV